MAQKTMCALSAYHEAKDKIQLRKNLRVVQSSIRFYELKPSLFSSDMIAEAFKAGLSMKL